MPAAARRPAQHSAADKLSSVRLILSLSLHYSAMFERLIDTKSLVLSLDRTTCLNSSVEGKPEILNRKQFVTFIVTIEWSEDTLTAESGPWVTVPD